MGRPTTPTALKLIKGNPGRRPLNKLEPKPQLLNDLTAPGWLPDSAKVVWDELAPRLSGAKILTSVDVDALAMGCVAIAQYRRAVEGLGNELIIPGKTEESLDYINPWASAQSMAFKQAMAIFTKFGMTPSDRAKLTVAPDDETKAKGSDYFA